MKKLITEEKVKELCKVSNGTSNGVMVYNDGLQVDKNGDVTVGRDIYVEDEVIIDNLGKVVDPDGHQFIPNLPSDAGTSTYVLHCVNGSFQWVKVS